MHRAAFLILPIAITLIVVGFACLASVKSTTAEAADNRMSVPVGADVLPQPALSQTAPSTTEESEPITLSHTRFVENPDVSNPAADFHRLPLAQQEEIKALSGRTSDAGKSYQVVEIKPGMVAVVANNGPQVVPVAVMNNDGTVSIHEY